ncbi:MAG: hypothetical protein ACHQX3_12180, partial [Nitrospirales bacterium]
PQGHLKESNMAKKDKKFDAPPTNDDPNPAPEGDMSTKDGGLSWEAKTDFGTAPGIAQAESAPAGDGGNGEAKPEPVRASWYLKTAEPDKNGRTDYRLAKYAGYPKKPSEIPITIDGQPAKLAVTSSGGWADEQTKGFNGYLQYTHPTKGYMSGWILFGHGVNPREMPLDFTVTDGTCEANPKRIPANPETEEARKAAFKAKMELKKVAKEAGAAGLAGEVVPTPEGTAPETPPAEQPAA